MRVRTGRRQLGLHLVLPCDADALGIRSRTVAGLPGRVLAPFLHLGLNHLLADTVPLVALGLLGYGSLRWGVLPVVVPAGVSWLGHLCGAAAGIIAAVVVAERSRRG